MIKNWIVLLLMVVFTYSVEARLQMMDGPVGVGLRVKPDSSALMHLRSITQGFKVPGLTTAQRDAIATPVIGLEIFNTDNNVKEFFDGLIWTSIGNGNSFFRVVQAAHGRAIGPAFIPIYFTGGVWTDAKADTQASLGTHVIVQIIDVNEFVVALSGRYTVTGHGLAVENHFFVSELVAGTVTLLEPPVFSNPIIFSEDANILHVMPFRGTSATGVSDPAAVFSVFGRAGNVVAILGDYLASLVTNIPAGDIAAVEVQAAIDELDAEKQPLNVELTGLATIPGNGLVARTAPGVYLPRTIVASTPAVVIANGDGVAGNPRIDIDTTQIDHDTLLNFLANEHIDWTAATQNLSTTGTASTGDLGVTGNISVTGTVDGRDIAVDGTKLDGIEPLADVTDTANVEAAGAVMDTDFGSNGLMVRTALGAYTNRSIVVGSTKLTITDGDGVAANPSLDVDQTQIDHDLLLNFVADEHIAHSGVLIDVSATNDGISGGGDITTTRTLLLDINSLTVSGGIAGVDEIVYFDIGFNDLRKITATTLQTFFGGEANTASNQGGGEGIFTAKVGVNLPFKSLIGGTNVTLSSTVTEITIDVPTAEANTASNLAGGVGIFDAKVGDDLQFKSLVAGINMSIVSGATTLTLNATGPVNRGELFQGGIADFFAPNTPLLVNATDEIINFTTTEVIDATFYTFTAGTDEINFNTAGRYRITYNATVKATASTTVRDVVCVVETASGGPFTAIIRSTSADQTRDTGPRSGSVFSSFTDVFAVGDDIRLVCQTNAQAANTDVDNANLIIEFLGI